MAIFNEFETAKEKQRREEHQAIRRDYLNFSNVILSGEVSPHRVLCKIAEKYGRSVMGVKGILKEAGIYKDARHPFMVSPSQNVQQMDLQF